MPIDERSNVLWHRMYRTDITLVPSLRSTTYSKSRSSIVLHRYIIHMFVHFWETLGVYER